MGKHFELRAIDTGEVLAIVRTTADDVAPGMLHSILRRGQFHVEPIAVQSPDASPSPSPAPDRKGKRR